MPCVLCGEHWYLTSWSLFQDLGSPLHQTSCLFFWKKIFTIVITFSTQFHHIILKAGHFLTGWKQKWVLPAAVHQPLGKMRRILNNQWIISAWWIWLTQGTMEVASLSTLWRFSLVSWLFWWGSFFFAIAASKRGNKTFWGCKEMSRKLYKLWSRHMQRACLFWVGHHH